MDCLLEKSLCFFLCQLSSGWKCFFWSCGSYPLGPVSVWTHHVGLTEWNLVAKALQDLCSTSVHCWLTRRQGSLWLLQVQISQLLQNYGQSFSKKDIVRLWSLPLSLEGNIMQSFHDLPRRARGTCRGFPFQRLLSFSPHPSVNTQDCFSFV